MADWVATEQALSESAALKPPDSQAQAELASYTNLRICTRQAREDCTRFATIRVGTAASNLDWNRNRRIDRAAVKADLNGLNGSKDSWKGIASDWALLKFHGLPRSGAKARVVELEDTPLRSCMSQPMAEEESDAP